MGGWYSELSPHCEFWGENGLDKLGSNCAQSCSKPFRSFSLSFRDFGIFFQYETTTEVRLPRIFKFVKNYRNCAREYRHQIIIVDLMISLFSMKNNRNSSPVSIAPFLANFQVQMAQFSWNPSVFEMCCNYFQSASPHTEVYSGQLGIC